MNCEQPSPRRNRCVPSCLFSHSRRRLTGSLVASHVQRESRSRRGSSTGRSGIGLKSVRLLTGRRGSGDGPAPAAASGVSFAALEGAAAASAGMAVTVGGGAAAVPNYANPHSLMTPAPKADKPRRAKDKSESRHRSKEKEKVRLFYLLSLMSKGLQLNFCICRKRRRSGRPSCCWEVRPPRTKTRTRTSRATAAARARAGADTHRARVTARAARLQVRVAIDLAVFDIKLFFCAAAAAAASSAAVGVEGEAVSGGLPIMSSPPVGSYYSTASGTTTGASSYPLSVAGSAATMPYASSHALSPTGMGGMDSGTRSRQASVTGGECSNIFCVGFALVRFGFAHLVSLQVC
jgi:hypothetical protein